MNEPSKRRAFPKEIWVVLAAAAFLTVFFGGGRPTQSFEPAYRTTGLVVAPERLAVVELQVLGFT